jgi:PIN domain nuclease of toxin-antitoxin system
VRFLLDTNALIFVMAAPGRLTPSTRATLATTPGTRASVISLWEIATKNAIGKLALRAQDVAARLAPANIALLPVSGEHAAAYAALPPPAAHRDPFDRMLVAQALHEGLTLVTSDATLAAYGVPVLPA